MKQSFAPVAGHVSCYATFTDLNKAFQKFILNVQVFPTRCFELVVISGQRTAASRSLTMTCNGLLPNTEDCKEP
jgi:hypothetical protein